MKKTKLLTSVSTLSIASAIFPITTTACKEEKNDIDKMHWSNEGDYNSAMTNNEFKAEFIKNNPVGQGDIPTDIYDNVDFAINGSLANWTITLTATEKSKEYKGSVTIDITAKINVVSLEWSTEGYYWGLMTKGAILGQFKQSNEPGDRNLPLDVYDNVDVNNDDPESKWIINIKANSSSNTYVGELKLTLGFSGSIFYDDKEYFVAENIDPNLFLTFDGNNYTTQNIPLADGKTITIGGSEEKWKKLTSVQINNFDTTKIIGDYFLSGCTNLKYLVLPDINNVETIGDNALFNCESLWDIDLLWLSNVTTIKNNFLNKCSKIKNIDLSPLSNVTEISNSFLTSIPSLTKVDITPLSNVVTIGNDFFASCSNLSDINLTALTKLKNIGNNFLASCKKINALDLSQLSNVVKIGNGFLYQCSLKDIDLSALTQLTSIGDDFLFESSNLANINLSGMTELKTIGSNFLFGCDDLTSVDFSSFTNVETIGNYFMFRCNKLTEINLSGLAHTKIIGNNFLNSCSSLKSIDLSSLVNLQHIGISFLENCISITSLDFSGLCNIVKIDAAFLYNTNNLIKINMGTIKPYLMEQSDRSFAVDDKDAQSFANGILILGSYAADVVGKFTFRKNTEPANFRNLYDENENTIVYNSQRYVITNTRLNPNIFCGKGNIVLRTTAGTLTITDHYLVSSLSLNQMDQTVDTLEDNFLYNFSNLKSIDFQYLPNISTIGKNFMYGCKNLKELDLSSFTNITSIDTSFLFECDELVNINMGNISADVMAESDNTFSVNNASSKAHLNGIILAGNYKDAIQNKFQARTQAPYRKWRAESKPLDNFI